MGPVAGGRLPVAALWLVGLRLRALEDAAVQLAQDVAADALLGASAGLRLQPWDRVGGFGRIGWTYAPVIDNLIGDTHDSGGLSVLLGVRGSY